MNRIPEELSDVLVSTDDTLGGEVRFVGSRVPLYVLLDNLVNGHSIEWFLEGYPGVTREQVLRVIEWQQSLTKSVFGLDRAG